MRKTLVRIVAVGFMALGLWNLLAFLFQEGGFMGGSMNLTYAIVAAALFQIGIDLFRIKEIARKLALGLLGLSGLLLLGYEVLAFSGPGFSSTESPMGYYLHNQEMVMQAALSVPWLALVIFAGVLLLQEKTRQVFRQAPPGTKSPG